MKKLFFLVMFFSTVSWASVYVSPVNFGVLNTLPSSGENNLESVMTVGGEAFYLEKSLMLGLKYDHFNQGDLSTPLGIQNQTDILALQVGWRFLTSAVSPYAFAGGGAFFQSVTSKIFSVSENHSSVTFGPNFGLGMLAQFSNRWAANLSVHYYPEPFLNGLNYMLSVGYVF